MTLHRVWLNRRTTNLGPHKKRLHPKMCWRFRNSTQITNEGVSWHSNKTWAWISSIASTVIQIGTAMTAQHHLTMVVNRLSPTWWVNICIASLMSNPLISTLVKPIREKASGFLRSNKSPNQNLSKVLLRKLPKSSDSSTRCVKISRRREFASMETDVFLRMEITNWLKEVSLQDPSLSPLRQSPKKRLQLIKVIIPRPNRRRTIMLK